MVEGFQDSRSRSTGLGSRVWVSGALRAYGLGFGVSGSGCNVSGQLGPRALGVRAYLAVGQRQDSGSTGPGRMNSSPEPGP